MSLPPTFQLFTSIRYDPLLLSSPENSRPELNFLTPSPFYMLAYHRDRMVEAAQHFDFDLVTARLADGVALHRELMSGVRKWQERQKEEEKEQGNQDMPLKLRISFDKTATMTLDFLPIPPVPLSTLYPTSLDPPSSLAQQPHPAPAGKKEFTPSPLTGGALHLGATDFLPSNTQDTTPPTIPAPPIWTLKIDTHPTPPSPYTLLKTSERTPYDLSRSRALPNEEEAASSVHREVVLWNSVREVTEGTLTSLYFFRGGKWVTPPVGVPSAFPCLTSTSTSTSTSPTDTNTNTNTTNADEGELRTPFPGRWGHSVRSSKVSAGAGGQRGTSRRWALSRGFCMEETVEVRTVEEGEGVWVSNGVRGFGFGRVVG
jgi:hypothetical protein